MSCPETIPLAFCHSDKKAYFGSWLERFLPYDFWSCGADSILAGVVENIARLVVIRRPTREGGRKG